MSSFTYTISKGGAVYTAEESIKQLEKEKADDEYFQQLFQNPSFIRCLEEYLSKRK